MRDGAGRLDGESGTGDSAMERDQELRAGESREVRLPNLGKGLEIRDPGPKMEIGDAPRFYMKIVRRKGKEYTIGDRKVPAAEEENFRVPGSKPIILPRVDLSILRNRDGEFRLPEVELVRFAMSARVLPILKQWAFMWLNPDDESQNLYRQVQRTFSRRDKPWNHEVALIAGFAAHGVPATQYQSTQLLYRMAGFAIRIFNGNAEVNDFDFFTKFSREEQASHEPYKFATRLLLAVWEDVEANQNGFFRRLFHEDCELSRPHRPEVRAALENWFVLDESLYPDMQDVDMESPEHPSQAPSRTGNANSDGSLSDLDQIERGRSPSAAAPESMRLGFARADYHMDEESELEEDEIREDQ